MRHSWRVLRRNPDIGRFLLANAAWEGTFAGARTFVVLYITVGLGESLGTSTLVLAAVAGGYVVAALVSGSVGDRFGLARVITWCSVVYGLGLLFAGFATEWHAWYLALIFTVAIFGGAVMTLAWGLLFKLMPPDDRGAISGLATTTKGIGLIFGTLLAGILIDVLAPSLPETQGYQVLWPVLAIPILLAIPLVFSLIKARRTHSWLLDSPAVLRGRTRPEGDGMTNRSKTTVVIGIVAAIMAVSAGVAIAGATLGSDTEKQAFLNDAAKRLDVTPAQLEAALRGAFDARIDAAVAAGKITKEQAEAMKQRSKDGGLPLFGGGRGHGGFGDGDRGDHGGPHGHHGAGLKTAATYLGLTEAQLRAELESGKSLADVAKAKGKTVAGLKETLKADLKTKLDAAVKAGRITQAQADEMLARMTEHLDEMIEGTFDGGRHHGGPMWAVRPPAPRRRRLLSSRRGRPPRPFARSGVGRPPRPGTTPAGGRVLAHGARPEA